MAEKTLYFWRETSGDATFLSQWYHCPFYDNDKKTIYSTAEHYMMYQKALLFNDAITAGQILKAAHPRDVKALGRKVRNFSSATWDAHKEDIVYRGNLLKFTQQVKEAEGDDDGDLREKLLATGDRELVEASPYDRIWGIGFAADNADISREAWGLNLLGLALMKVREELK